MRYSNANWSSQSALLSSLLPNSKVVLWDPSMQLWASCSRLLAESLLPCWRGFQQAWTSPSGQNPAILFWPRPIHRGQIVQHQGTGRERRGRVMARKPLADYVWTRGFSPTCCLLGSGTHPTAWPASSSPLSYKRVVLSLVLAPGTQLLCVTSLLDREGIGHTQLMPQPERRNRAAEVVRHLKVPSSPFLG